MTKMREVASRKASSLPAEPSPTQVRYAVENIFLRQHIAIAFIVRYNDNGVFYNSLKHESAYLGMAMDVYILDINCISDLQGKELLTPERRSRMERYLRKTDQARCLGAGLLLRYAFGEEGAAQILPDDLGKPYLPEGPFFNLSHSGDKVVLLVADRPSGVDIEQIAPWSAAVARKVFTPDEQRWLREQEEDSAFFRLWTAKEAIMKALGLGFRLPPESFEVSREPGLPNPVRGSNWYLQWWKIEGHMLCCAVDIPLEEICIREIFPEDVR